MLQRQNLDHAEAALRDATARVQDACDLWAPAQTDRRWIASLARRAPGVTPMVGQKDEQGERFVAFDKAEKEERDAIDAVDEARRSLEHAEKDERRRALGSGDARQALAVLLARETAVSRNLITLNAAHVPASERKWKASAAVEEATKAIETAMQAEADFEARSLLGAVQEPPLSIKDARAALVAADDEKDSAARVEAAIVAQIHELEIELSSLQHRKIKAAIDDVVRVDPRTADLASRFYAARDEYLALHHAMTSVGIGRLHEEHKNWGDLRFDKATGPHRAAWDAAIAGLRADAATELPEVNDG